MTILATLALGACSVCLAQEAPPWLYLGAGAGRATLREDPHVVPLVFAQAQHDTGWKGFVGLRPASFLGAELEYISFGESATSQTFGSLSSVHEDTLGQSRAWAVSAFALGYLPVPLPRLDVYGKAGIAELRTRDVNSVRLICPPGTVCPYLSQPIPGLVINPAVYSSTDTDLAYGAGVRLRLGTVSLSAEYERVRQKAGDPDLLSLAISWRLH
jgi:hypothetical protein